MAKEHLMRAGKRQPVLFFVLFFVFALLTACVLVATLWLCKGVLVKSQHTAAAGNLRTYVGTVTSSTKILTEVAAQVGFNSYVSDWVNTSHLRIDRPSMQKILKNHSSIVTANPMIFSIDIYSANSNKVLSTHSGYYDVCSPTPSGATGCQQFLDWSKERQKNGLLSFIGCDAPEKGLGSLVYMSYISNTGSQGVVAVTSKIEQLFWENMPSNLDLYVYDAENGWVYPVKGAREGDDSAETFVQIPRNSLADGSVSLRLNESDYTMLACPAFEGRLYVLALIRDVTLKTMVQEHLPVVLGLCALALLIMLCISKAMVGVAYKPVQRLLDAASEGDEKLSPGEPIHRLGLLMEEYGRQKEELKRSMDMNRQYLHERQIKDIVFGSYTPREDDPVPAILNADGCYVVLAIMSVKGADQQTSLDAFAQDAFSRIQSRAREFLCLSKSSALMLVNLDERWNPAGIACCLEEDVKDFAGRVVVGISDMSRAIQDIPVLYEQANMACREARQRDTFVMVYSEIPGKTDASPEWMKLWGFVNALRTQSKTQVDQELQLLLERRADMSPDEKQSFFLYLVYSIMRIYKDNGAEIETNSFADVMELSTDAEQYEYILNLCERFVALRDEYNHKYKRASVETAVQYLRLNFDKPISLSILADELGMSPSYLSELLKKELNMNYLSFVHELRVERARELLSGTDLSIQEVALAVGYDTVHSFIRNFKKIMSTTPAVFRMKTLGLPSFPRERHSIS